VSGLRGVNLGGWLVLEKWMAPSLFAGLAAADETTWCAELGPEATPRLRAHWDSFIQRSDFEWLASVGVNALRIPVGHWLFGPPYPYHPKYGADPHPFVRGGIDVLDRALDWAGALGLRVLLDLHAAPGCQNGFDNGGISGVCEWHTREEYVSYSLDVLARLAERYRASDSLCGIEVLNEPRWDVPTPFLLDYYGRAYEAIRAHCPAERVAVVFHDGFRSHREYLDFMKRSRLENVLFDVHHYQCFSPEDVALDASGHLHRAAVTWRDEADLLQLELGRPAIAGEWSLGLDPNGFVRSAERPRDHGLRDLDRFQEDVVYRGYAAAQLVAFERYSGWFFWSYRTEDTPAWCFRECVERGWLPARFQ
jgi:glucan 1,3-beta-glucosidase